MGIKHICNARDVELIFFSCGSANMLRGSGASDLVALGDWLGGTTFPLLFSQSVGARFLIYILNVVDYNYSRSEVVKCYDFELV